MKHFGDITKLNGAELPVVDVITGGSPCQDLSVAGKREGLDGERSGLFLEQIRIVKEMRENDRANGRTGFMVRPRYMVWENVPGAFSSNKGADFQTVLTEIVRIAEPVAPPVPLPTKKWSKSGCIYDELGGGQLLGEYTMHSFGEQPNMLMAECGIEEHRKDVSVSHLSQILVDSPQPKYSLSKKACMGILRRSEKRGKALPPILKEALENQISDILPSGD